MILLFVCISLILVRLWSIALFRRLKPVIQIAKSLELHRDENDIYLVKLLVNGKKVFCVDTGSSLVVFVPMM